MARFITFGCSITYGEGLPDCVSENRLWAGPEPSKISWASLLANNYRAEMVNLSLPGASNFYISNKILEFNWQPGDIALVLFTYFHRYTIFDDGELPYNITPHDVNVRSKMHRAKLFYELFDNQHLVLNDMMSIDAAFYCLAYHRIPVVAKFVDDVQRDLYLNSTHINDNSWINMLSSDHFFNYRVDDGLDVGKHPGPESHRLFSESLAKDLDNIINMRK